MAEADRHEVVETYFSGVRERWIPLYRAIREKAGNVLEPFTEHKSARGITWKHASSFAEFSAKADCLVIAFPAETLHEDWLPAKTLQTSAKRVVHYFELDDTVDDSSIAIFLDRIRDAYALTKSAHGDALVRGDPVLPGPAEYAGIDEYIALFPAEQQEVMRKVREIIHRAAPEATEKIAYQMPTFYQGGNLVHFAAQKNHLGFYPGADGVAMFEEELASYKTSKGTVQFPWDQPIPYGLIERITESRARQQGAKKQKASPRR